MSETQINPDDLDKWFEELEANLDREEVSRLAQNVLERHQPTLEDKVLADFHGNAPIIESEFYGVLPKITPKAQIFVAQNLEEGQLFRFGVAGGGCSGFNYLFEPTETIDAEDIVFCESPKSIIDPESLKFLYGSIIDLEDSGMNKMLKVVNPGARASCGCGTSFAFDEELLDIYENV